MAQVFAGPAVYESASAVYMARIVGTDGAELEQADLSSITLYVRDHAAQATPIADSPYTLTIADVVFDTLQTSTDNALWTVDTTGYNFKYDLLPAQLPDGDKMYRFEFVFVTTDSKTLVAALDVPTINLFNN